MHRTKIAKELALPPQRKIVFKKFPNTSEKKIHQQQTMTQKLNIDNAYIDTEDRRSVANIKSNNRNKPAVGGTSLGLVLIYSVFNMGIAKMAGDLFSNFFYFKLSFVLADKELLFIRQLRKAPTIS